MRRILFTVMAAAALCVAAPTVALAHNGGHHHKRHHRRVRHEFFKAHRHDSSGTSGSSSGTSEPTAGTVTSFADNVLTITLTNGNTVSGTVTNDSELKCENPQMQNGDNSGDNSGDDNGAGDEHGDAVFHHGDGGGDNGDQGDDNNQGGDNSNDQTCTPTPGMAVRKAELTIDGNGAFWSEVELVNSSTSTTTSSQS
ncbi:MAG TPA: hypothetical protein VGH67_10280 [Solirubrobacteraceae bacterium]